VTRIQCGMRNAECGIHRATVVQRGELVGSNLPCNSAFRVPHSALETFRVPHSAFRIGEGP